MSLKGVIINVLHSCHIHRGKINIHRANNECKKKACSAVIHKKDSTSRILKETSLPICKKKKNQNPKATSKFHQVPKLSSYVRYLIWFSMGKILFGWFETMPYKEYDKTWRKLSSSEIELSPLSSSLVFRSVSVCGQQRRPRIQAEI